jgi:hypothetical protein
LTPHHHLQLLLLLLLLRMQAIEDAPAYVRWFDGLFPPGRKMGPMMEKVLWQGIMKGDFEDPEKAQQHFQQWNESVRQVGLACSLVIVAVVRFCLEFMSCAYLALRWAP